MSGVCRNTIACLKMPAAGVELGELKSVAELNGKNLRKDLHPEYIKNSYNSTTKR